MKKFALSILFTGLLVAGISSSCSEDVMDKIDTNPNEPVDVPADLLLQHATTNVVFSVSGTDLAWYSSVFVEHTTGVHGQLENADKRAGINTTIGNNAWNNIYAGALKDLSLVVSKCSEGGSESGKWVQVGMAKILMAYTLGITTDLFGDVPYSDALKGSASRYPKYDTQQQVYESIQKLLDEAIEYLSRPGAVAFPTSNDLLYGPSTTNTSARWIKMAYALKARYHNRLSLRDPQGSATKALDAVQKAFANASESAIFTRFQNTAIGEHPWAQEQADRSHHAVSKTYYDLLSGLNDPRAANSFFRLINGRVSPAPNGSALSDQGAGTYSRASATVVFATAPMPLITFDEVKFIEAEANLRLGNRAAAKTAYETAVTAALARVGATGAATYLAQANVNPPADQLTLKNIIEQKYISFWLFQPIEAFNDFRRTGFPALTNTAGPAPRRFPYPQREFDTNASNVPKVQLTNDVWWAQK